MAKWKVSPGSVNNSLHGAISYDDHESFWQVEQDETPYIDMVKEEQQTHSSRHTHHKKFATIPDIVAMELLTKYNLDIHDPAFMQDKAALKRLKHIIMWDYPYLVVNKA